MTVFIGNSINVLYGHSISSVFTVKDRATEHKWPNRRKKNVPFVHAVSGLEKYSIEFRLPKAVLRSRLEGN